MNDSSEDLPRTNFRVHLSRGQLLTHDPAQVENPPMAFPPIHLYSRNCDPAGVLVKLMEVVREAVVTRLADGDVKARLAEGDH